MKEGAKGYDTNFPLEHAQKDVTFALALGDNHGINMGIGGAAKGKSNSNLCNVTAFLFPSFSLPLLHPPYDKKMTE